MKTSSRFCSTRSTRSTLSTLITLPLASLAFAGCSLAPTEPPALDAASEPVADQTAVSISGPVVTSSQLKGLSIAFEASAEPSNELIARIRSGFSLPASDHAAVARELAWYAGHPDYITRVFGRGSRYLYHIAGVLEARGMPADLALLPIVESAFDPFAYSRGRASGLWQIIPGTGDMLGLKQNWWYDGRRDIVDSTRAALDYLEHLHQRFDGDWLLAVAAYNSGEGHVARAINRAKSEGRATDFWSLRDNLRSETAAYVPKLLAIRDLVARPDAHGIDLPVIDNVPFFAVVETEGQIDIALAAELGSLDINALYELNPGVNRWATDPDGPHRLLVPVEQATDIATALDSLEATERVRWTRHQISRGETLSEIAENYETTPAVLREVNALAGTVIRTGDHLMIPHASAAAGSYSLSLDARTARQQDRERDGNRVDYRVKAGDSLWEIANRFGVSTNELASWNAMAPRDVLSVGRNIVIWSDDPLAASLASIAGPSEIRRVDYVVRQGDSLAAIASRFRVTVDNLLDWNELSADRYLQPGQALVLYVDVTEQST